MIAHRMRGAQQKIVEIQRVVLLEQVLVFAINPRHISLVKIPARGGEGFGGLKLVLRFADRSVNGGRGEVRRRHLQLLHRFLDELGLIRRIVNAEVRWQPQLLGVMAKDPQAQAVEGADGGPGLIEPAEIAQRPIRHPGDALFHFPGRFVGEGDGQNRRRGNAQRNQIRHPTGDDARFPASRAGDDQQRTVHMRDGLPLSVG